MTESWITFLTGANMDHMLCTVDTIRAVGTFAYVWASNDGDSVLIVSRVSLTEDAQLAFMEWHGVVAEEHDMYPKFPIPPRNDGERYLYQEL
jgi:hypothetical protein